MGSLGLALVDDHDCLQADADAWFKVGDGDVDGDEPPGEGRGGRESSFRLASISAETYRNYMKRQTVLRQSKAKPNKINRKKTTRACVRAGGRAGGLCVRRV